MKKNRIDFDKCRWKPEKGNFPKHPTRRTPLDNSNTTEKYKLKDGSKIAVIGGGPSGTFFSYFLLDMAARIDLPPSVVRRGIESYRLHMDAGSVHIKTPTHEKGYSAPKTTRTFICEYYLINPDISQEEMSYLI